MNKPSRRVGGALIGALAVALLATPALATTPLELTSGTTPDTGGSEGKLVLVLDSSGSMGDPDSAGEPKIQSARTALEAVVGGLAADQQVGLRVFGANELGTSNPAACTDSDLVVPIGAGNQSDLSAAVADYEPFGETPIAYALQEAGKDLGTEGQRSILLVSDGISTCDPDPCEVAADLAEAGVDLAIHVVGFDVDDAAREQLRCIAEAGNGQYVDAQDAESLTSALTQVSTRAFRPFAISGEPVEGTLQVTDAPSLAAGQFTDTMPSNSDTQKHYLLSRTAPGSTVHVGVTMRPTSGGLGSFLLRLETADGRSCDVQHGSPWSAGAGNSFGTAAVNSGGAKQEACEAAEELVLTVELQGSSAELQDGAFEMVVLEEPPVADQAELPGRAPTPEWQDMEPGEPVTDVVAGSSLNGSPELEPGRTYSSELTRGEIVFFRVPVEHGQRLQALVEFPKPTGMLAESTGAVSDIADIQIIGPNRAEAHRNGPVGDLRSRAIMAEDHAVQAAVTTAEVRWSNRSFSADAGASLPGDYWVAVSMTSNNELTLPIPFTLTTELIGEPSGVPTYVDTAVTDDPDATAEPVTDSEAGQTPDVESTTGQTADDAAVSDASDAAAPPVDVSDEGTPTGLVIGLVALGLALLGAGGFALTRALRSS